MLDVQQVISYNRQMAQIERIKESPEHVFPLGSFSKFVVASVPLLNTDRIELEHFITQLLASLPSSRQINELVTFGPIEVIERAQQDIGMAVSALNYKGIDVSSQFPQLIDALLTLSRVTGLPPRDCKYAYSYVNAKGAATRSFTNEEEELALIRYDQDFAREFSIVISGINRLLQSADWENKPHLAIVAQ